MEACVRPSPPSEAGFVSTGNLPTPEDVQRLLDLAYERFRRDSDGAVSEVYPALSEVPAGLFGVCVVGVSGNVFCAGDCGHEFSIMSVSKPFVFALICEQIGVEEARTKIGVNATGYPFNSLTGIEQNPSGLTNPMVNAGAIAATSLVPGDSAEEKWRFIHDGLSRFAGRRLTMN